MLSSALASKKAPEAIPMNTAEQMAQQLGATVRPRTSITAIDAPKHSVRVENEEIPYSKLVLGAWGRPAPATDQRQRRRRRDDRQRSRRLRAISRSYQRAQDCCHRRSGPDRMRIRAGPVERRLQSRSDRCREPAAPALAAARRRRDDASKARSQRGRWHLGTSVVSLDADGAQTRVTLANGDVFEADMFGLPRLDCGPGLNSRVRRRGRAGGR